MTLKQRAAELILDAMSKTCAHCTFFEGYPEEEMGWCRRYPPRGQLIQDEHGDWFPMSVPTPTMTTETCGEWRPKQ